MNSDGNRPVTVEYKVPVPIDVFSFITYLWLAVFAFWFLTALGVKRTVRTGSRGGAQIADFITALGWWLLLARGLRVGPLAWRFLPDAPATAYTGLEITVAGLAFAVWARLSLGRNWSALPELKSDHQLSRSGPYGIVRHPIYSGFMLATVGTAIAFGEVGGLVSCALVILAWGYKARLEEAFLSQQFGPAYDQYRREVKALIPLVW